MIPYNLMTISDYVQDITENEPDTQNQADGHGRDLKDPEGIDPLIIAVGFPG